MGIHVLARSHRSRHAICELTIWDSGILADRGRCGDNLAGLADMWQHEVFRSRTLYIEPSIYGSGPVSIYGSGPETSIGLLRTKGMFHKLSLAHRISITNVS